MGPHKSGCAGRANAWAARTVITCDRCGMAYDPRIGHCC